MPYTIEGGGGRSAPPKPTIFQNFLVWLLTLAEPVIQQAVEIIETGQVPPPPPPTATAPAETATTQETDTEQVKRPVVQTLPDIGELLLWELPQPVLQAACNEPAIMDAVLSTTTPENAMSLLFADDGADLSEEKPPITPCETLCAPFAKPGMTAVEYINCLNACQLDPTFWPALNMPGMELATMSPTRIIGQIRGPIVPQMSEQPLPTTLVPPQTEEPLADKRTSKDGTVTVTMGPVIAGYSRAGAWNSLIEGVSVGPPVGAEISSSGTMPGVYASASASLPLAGGRSVWLNPAVWPPVGSSRIDQGLSFGFCVYVAMPMSTDAMGTPPNMSDPRLRWNNPFIELFDFDWPWQ